MGPVAVELSADDEMGPAASPSTSQLQARRAGGSSMASLVLPSGQRIRLGDRTVTVGRLPECTISINDSNISRQHAEIAPVGRRVRRRSTSDSTNGTLVNGIRITGQQRLNEGDIISFGSTHVRFEAS